MFRWLALIFLVVPFVELWILLRVGDWIGFWPTVGLVLAEALVGAVLLATPGFISDIAGMLFLIPPTRKIAAGLIETYVKKRLDRGGSAFDFRVVTPRGAYGRRRVVDVEGAVVEDRELHARGPEVRAPEVRTEVVEGVLEGEVVDSSMRRLGPGTSTPEQ